MVYLFVSLLMVIFAPQIGEGFADVLRDGISVGWHGFWFWFIGLITIGICD